MTPELPLNIDKPEAFLQALEEAFTYDMDTGKFYWKREAAKGKCKVGDETGSMSSEGHIFLRFNYHMCMAHSAAWFFIFGVWPKEVDHKNGVRNDNKIGNLRKCTRSQSNINGVIRSDNRSGWPGVHFHKALGKWGAYINRNGRRYNLGLYISFEKAKEARVRKERELYGEFAS